MEVKKSRIDNTTDLIIDRISSLPDSILGHILSSLPTKKAVATSILSKRWKFAWVTVHNLNFFYVDSWEGHTKDENMKFVQFVDRVLLLNDGGSLNKFSLDWHGYTISSHVSSWINIAVTRNVHELYLSLGDGEIFGIPISGFNCDLLRSLELNEIRFVCDATAVCLPRLESLKLDHVYFVSTKACEKLISGCPMLQYLYLDIYPFDDSEVEELDMLLSVFSCDSLQSLELNGNLFVPAAIVVCLPRLEKLKLELVNFESEEACEKLISRCPTLQSLSLYLNISFTDNGDDDDDIFTCIISSVSLRRLKICSEKKSSLKLNVSSLEYLEVSGDISEISVEKSLRSLAQADFRIWLVEHGSPNNSNNSIVEAVRAFDCVKVLTLSSGVMWALSHATVSLSTEFKRLVKLVAETYSSSLQDVIQSSNNLEDLIIYQHSMNIHYLRRWTTPVKVPRCLSNSLKRVRFCGYNGSEDERDMIRYMLEHGSALEVMHISCYYKGEAEKLKLLREICVFPRKSTVCEVHFSA